MIIFFHEDPPPILTVFYRWQKEFFENGAAAFGRQTLAGRGPEQQRVAALEQKLQRRNEILAELMDEHFALKQVGEAPENGP